MENEQNKSILSIVSVAVVTLLGIFAIFTTVNRVTSQVATLGTDLTYNSSNQSYTDGADFRQNVQAIAERFANLTAGQVLQADSQGRIQAVSPSALSSLSGLTITSSSIGLAESYESVTATNTIEIAETGKTFYISGVPMTHTLPSVTSSAGVVYKFVISGAISGTSTIAVSDGDNRIEGTLIVAGAVVDCDAEDAINFMGDGENVGDFVELRSNGTKWFIGASGSLTSAKTTCTAV